MITEDYVSFEVAEILKEKGFDSDCNAVYDLEKPKSCADGKLYFNFDNKNPDRFQDLCAAPTLHMAMKWLRGKGIIITITYTRCSMQTIGSQMMFGFNIQNVQGDLLSENTEVAYGSYEQSEMDAIKYTLENLI